MKRAALYARVSTLQNQDPELQLRELREHCQRKGWTITQEYVDRVSSAKVRPQQQLLLADADAKKFDQVLVWKFDRFARSAIELCQTLERLQKLGITFASLTEQIDTGTAAGKLVFTILGAVAEMERSLIRERVKAGLQNAKAKGHFPGRPRYKTNDALIAQASELHDQGHSYRDIASRLGVSHQTIAVIARRSPRPE